MLPLRTHPSLRTRRLTKVWKSPCRSHKSTPSILRHALLANRPRHFNARCGAVHASAASFPLANRCHALEYLAPMHPKYYPVQRYMPCMNATSPAAELSVALKVCASLSPFRSHLDPTIGIEALRGVTWFTRLPESLGCCRDRRLEGGVLTPMAQIIHHPTAMVVGQVIAFVELSVISTEILVFRGRRLFQLRSMFLFRSIPIPETNAEKVDFNLSNRTRHFDPWMRQMTPNSKSIQLLSLSREVYRFICS